MTRSRLTCALALLLLCSSIPAQQLSVTAPSSTALQTSLVRDPQAISVLSSAIAALGRTAPGDTTASGTVTVSFGTKSETGTVSVLSRGLNQTIEQISLGDWSRKTIVSGWDVASDDGSGQKLIPGIVSHAVYFPLPFLVGSAGNPDFSFQYLGAETLNGNPVQHIRMWTTFASEAKLQPLSKQSMRDIWIDSASNLPIRMSFDQQPASGASGVRFDLDLSEYRNFGGVLYPTVIHKYINGTEWMTITLSSINLNTGLTDSTFAITCTN